MTTNAFLELREWLVAEKSRLGGDGSHRRLLADAFYLLEDMLNVILVNAAHATGYLGVRPKCPMRRGCAKVGECGLALLDQVRLGIEAITARLRSSDCWACSARSLPQHRRITRVAPA
jgi:hypothetical protein